MQVSRSALAVLTLTLTLAIAGSAHAQGAHTGGAHTGGGGARAESPPRDPFSARYTEASRAWHEGRYEDALAAFRALHASSGRDELLYDIGVTYDRLGRLEDAVDAFEQYLAAMPSAPHRLEVERRIASLQGDIAARDRAAASPTTAPVVRRAERPVMTLMGTSEPAAAPAPAPIASPPPVEDPEPEPYDGGPSFVWTWPLLVLTAGAAVAAPIVWVEGEARLEQLVDECAAVGGCTEDEIAAGGLDDYEIATNVLLATAITLGVVTAIVFFVEGSSRTTIVQYRAGRPRVRPGGFEVRF